MEWRLFATLAEAAGDTEVAVDADGDTVGDAFDVLLAAFEFDESLADLVDVVAGREAELFEGIGRASCRERVCLYV